MYISPTSLLISRQTFSLEVQVNTIGDSTSATQTHLPLYPPFTRFSLLLIAASYCLRTHTPMICLSLQTSHFTPLPRRSSLTLFLHITASPSISSPSSPPYTHARHSHPQSPQSTKSHVSLSSPHLTSLP